MGIMAQTPLESEGVRARPRAGAVLWLRNAARTAPSWRAPTGAGFRPPKQRAEFYVARLIRADPVSVESVGDASLELNQRRRTRLDIGRVEHREISPSPARPPPTANPRLRQHRRRVQ
jgi:hypothetical protein